MRLDFIHRTFFDLSNTLCRDAILFGQLLKGRFGVTQPAILQYRPAALVKLLHCIEQQLLLR